MEINELYTNSDHENRGDDTYAFLKYRLTLAWLNDYQKDPKDKKLRLLNIGCGAGDFNVLAQKAGYLVDGIEPNRVALNIAKQKSTSDSRLESVSVFDFESPAKYDVIVMHDVLEHIDDDYDAIKKVRSLMASHTESVFILSVPAHMALFGFHDEQIGHFRRYNKKNLKQVVAPYFDIRKIRYIALLGIPAVLYFSKWKRIPYPVNESGLKRSIFDYVCHLEERIHFGIGSSLILMCTPNSNHVGS